ncbi:MAG: hypothetical protein KBD16_01485 [Candidatus Pacebacteria bacterium]|nr:hypothetical protein [Candidatus Paceibacterota bacterium]
MSKIISVNHSSNATEFPWRVREYGHLDLALPFKGVVALGVEFLPPIMAGPVGMLGFVRCEEVVGFDDDWKIPQVMEVSLTVDVDGFAFPGLTPWSVIAADVAVSPVQFSSARSLHFGRHDRRLYDRDGNVLKRCDQLVLSTVRTLVAYDL